MSDQSTIYIIAPTRESQLEPTDIITQSLHRLNGWIHMEATLLRMLSLLRRTHVYH